jgi:hypothetical protein
MSAPTRPDDFARVDYTCKKYKPGHQVHFIQSRLSLRGPAGVPVVIEAVDDDGTIRFTGGTTKWNHDVRRVQALFEHVGPNARLRGYNVLAIGTYLVCVSDGPDPCDGRARVSGESLTDELTRRGGIAIPGPELLAQLGLTPGRSPAAPAPPEADDDDHETGSSSADEVSRVSFVIWQ